MRINEFYDKNLDEGVNDPHIFKAIFLAGPPGAGKNHVIQQLGLNAAGLKLQDIDKTMFYLKKSKNDLASFLHPTNDDYDHSLNKTVSRQSLLTQNMLGLVINTTGRDSERVMVLKRELASLGYDVFMVYVNVDYSIAFDRIKYREKFATDPWDRRPVEPTYFDNAYDSATKNADFYALMFGDHFSYVTNNVPHEKIDTEEEMLEIDKDAIAEFNQDIRVASKRVDAFLRKPITPKASQIVASLKGNRS